MRLRVQDHEGNTLSLTGEDTSEEVNERSLQDQVEKALKTNRSYLNLSAPTQAQTEAEVKALARQQNRLIRLVLGLLDGTD